MSHILFKQVTMKKSKIIYIFGTRPEAIKMAPLILRFKKDKSLKTIVVLTGQHRQMLDRVMKLFNIKADYDLNIMKPGQDLYDITSNVLLGLRDILRKEKPDYVLIQGDTTSTFAGSLAAYYEHIAVAHVEAGLRTWNKYAPWPEEINRKMTTAIADLHFVPTSVSRGNLVRESIDSKHIFITGNSGIDALMTVRERVLNDKKVHAEVRAGLLKNLPEGILKKIETEGQRMVLITGHRRENFGQGFKDICIAMKTLAQKYPDVLFIYPVHLNPNVRKPVFGLLKDIKNIVLCQPLDYPEFVYMMINSYIIITDSGGVQEEAPSLGKPVLVMREVTERPEAVSAGTVKLVGTDKNKIISETMKLLDSTSAYDRMAHAMNPYGDGKTSDRILKIIKADLAKKK